MKAYVADTHALYWHLTSSSKLGTAAGIAFEEADRGDARIYIPSIVLAELFYLNEKLKRPLEFAEVYADLAEAEQFVMVPFTGSDVLDLERNYVVPENARPNRSRHCATP